MTDGQMVSGGAASSNAAPTNGTNIKHVVVSAAIGAVATVLQDVYKVPADEAEALLLSFRTLLNRLFQHKAQ